MHGGFEDTGTLVLGSVNSGKNLEVMTGIMCGVFLNSSLLLICMQ